MKKVTTQIRIIITVILFLLYGITFAQTKNQTESTTISTGHASFTAKAQKNGSALEVWVYNNSTTKYTVSFTSEVKLRGEKGEFTKTIRYSGTIAPNGNDYTSPVMIGWANASTDMYHSLVDGKIFDFNATPVEAENNSVSSNNNTQNTTSSSTETRYNTNPQVEEAVERQNRLNTLKEEQDAQQKAQQQADYEKAVSYEQQRQESIRQTNETVDAVTGVITGYLNQQAEEKRRQQEAEERRLEREYQQRMEEYERKVAIEAKISNRKTALAEFPAKDIPLGSKEKAASIYYFVYAFDNTINNEYGATVYVSNVFEIGKYNDGTLPYTANIKNEITNLTPFEEVLHGYYYTKEEAEELRQTLISILSNNGVTINEVNYKGKPAAQSNLLNNTGTSTNASKYGKTIDLNNDQKLAPAKINTEKPSELPREEQKKEDNKYGKTIKLD
jgi:hypothetical protein